ncbi:hypothetical protein CQW23_19600 [Capsicum baccatum]|uniref:Uncharacterized protein n=1 Tax=Capsicum baccatum TaxID=33114 RepID=A0A2G2W694_CAPBA|nr:hypothetical protein CQW23_19600 [Capsicum baccatum]
MDKVIVPRKCDGPPYGSSLMILKRMILLTTDSQSDGPSFLSRNNNKNNPIANNSLQLVEAHRNANVCGLNLQLTQILGEVEIEKKRGESLDQMRNTSQSQCCWEAPISQLDLQELEQLKDSMEALKKYVTNHASKFMVNEIANSSTFFGPCAKSSDFDRCFANDLSLIGGLLSHSPLRNTYKHALSMGFSIGSPWLDDGVDENAYLQLYNWCILCIHGEDLSNGNFPGRDLRVGPGSILQIGISYFVAWDCGWHGVELHPLWL